MTTIPSFKLNTGATIPGIGLGCGSWDRSREAIAASKDWILSGLKLGYRHLDTASVYLTESAVGQAIRESGVPREDIFVTTKLFMNQPVITYKAFYDSLERLGLDYVDLYLMHWPMTVQYTGDDLESMDVVLPKDEKGNLKLLEHPNFNETWTMMELLLNTGKVKAIGVSNFSIKTLEQLFKTAKIVPAVNQVEIHPLLVQEELVQYCKKKGIQVVAYSPTGHSKVLELPLIKELAAKYNVTPAQIVLAWHLARGVVAIPKSANPERQKLNITLPTLDPEDVKRISSLDRNERLTNADETGRVFGGWTLEQMGW
ncbi:Aldo/keto reductase [Panus rudis PR-1116 ss-1]|nr:Aldo/keto reductase [Panus rudis PR-1116 ss-1]